jgi:hypothetical protein
MNRSSHAKGAEKISWKLDRNALSFAPAGSSADDAAWWRSRTPGERLAGIEHLRQVNYGYDPSTSRLQRVLEIVERPPR